VYGFGIVGVLLILEPLAVNLLLQYIGAAALTTALELATGYAMEKLFHQRWWDYSKMPLNLGGYVCLPFSLLWGAACLLIADALHPNVAHLVSLIPEPWSTVLPCAFGAVLVLDTCVAVARAFRLDKRLAQIDEVASALRAVSDRLGAPLADGALKLKATDERALDELQAANRRARTTLLEADENTRAELRARYTELLNLLGKEHKRFLKAFPQMRSVRHPGALDAVREKLLRRKDESDR